MMAYASREMPPFSSSHSTVAPLPRRATSRSSPRRTSKSSESVKLNVWPFGRSTRTVGRNETGSSRPTLTSRRPNGSASRVMVIRFFLSVTGVPEVHGVIQRARESEPVEHHHARLCPAARGAALHLDQLKSFDLNDPGEQDAVLAPQVHRYRLAVL